MLNTNRLNNDEVKEMFENSIEGEDGPLGNELLTKIRVLKTQIGKLFKNEQ